ncbi:MAG: L,D-transpeptidase family protein [Ignavibacteria bacterium]|nr:L,D-transpeptidase family protein [Ignavibacteria bacterium]
MVKKIILIFISAMGVLLACAVIYNFLPEEKLQRNDKIDKIIVVKSLRKMEVYSNGKLLKVYNIAVSRNSIGDKQFEGDEKTPEGIYFINDKNPNSGYHKNLGISYPDSTDIKEAGLLNKPAGGDIKIHGIRNYMGFIGKFHRLRDWTRGCIAVTDEEIDEIYEHTPIGTPIEIKP